MYNYPLYAALGDSLTVGVGSTIFMPNFVKCFHQSLESFFRQPIARLVFARNGATTGEILESLSRPDVSQAVGSARFITLTGGGNDLLRAGKVWLKTRDNTFILSALHESFANIEQIITKIIDLHSSDPEPFMIRILNLYNPVPYIPESHIWLETFNEKLLSLERFAEVRIADIYHAFYGREPHLLARDHTHPNPLGYRIMADTTARLGFAPVALQKI
ncbi:GDSL-type esterase/lipase family protein [Sporolactobacillus putidus]|uniref:Spore germination lipase LipC n=1 Tax=Sporolactobacillus putidus TaxID=492735 RepID=A0A917S490_9BACL|nr:GDSL-type esterase/lipase family protein [Sporolactobacillus putidus]GGL53359.1 spore germination lipase LipC [Sporolactobacillus putidus]